MVDFSSWVTAISTAVLVIITFANLRIFKQTFESRLDPHVIVTLDLDEESSAHIIMIVIRNIGTGLAEDVTFEISKQIPLWAGGIKPESADIRETMQDGPLINGILTLGPGEKRKLLWGQYYGLLEAVGPDPIVVTCHFKRDGKPRPPVVCRLDIPSFKHMAVPRSPLLEIAEQSKKLVQATEKISQGLSKIS